MSQIVVFVVVVVFGVGKNNGTDDDVVAFFVAVLFFVVAVSVYPVVMAVWGGYFLPLSDDGAVGPPLNCDHARR